MREKSNKQDLLSHLDKLIYFQRENTAILSKTKKSWFQNNMLPKLKHKYSYEDDFIYTFTGANFLNKTYV